MTIANREAGLKRRGIIPKNLSSLIGKNHWNWKGGIAKIDKIIRRMPEYMKWRTDIFKRDGYACVDCGFSKGYITAHHIKSFASILRENNISSTIKARSCQELWDLNNGKTVCEPCHSNTDNYRGRVKMRETITV